MEKKQTKKETVEKVVTVTTAETAETITETEILETLETLLIEYKLSKVKTSSVLSNLAKAWFVLYFYNNVGACKKIIKTITSERNLFIKYLDFNGLSVAWNVKTDELTIRKFEDFNADKIKPFEDFIEYEKDRKEIERKESLKDLTVFTKEYEKKVKNLFKDLTEEQKAILKNIIQNIN